MFAEHSSDNSSGEIWKETEGLRALITYDVVKVSVFHQLRNCDST